MIGKEKMDEETIPDPDEEMKLSAEKKKEEMPPPDSKGPEWKVYLVDDDVAKAEGITDVISDLQALLEAWKTKKQTIVAVADQAIDLLTLLADNGLVMVYDTTGKLFAKTKEGVVRTELSEVLRELGLIKDPETDPDDIIE